MKAGGVAYGGLRIGRCARSWATIRKSRVVINPIQTRLADWLHAQRCRTTRLVALTSIVRGPWPKGVASVYSVTRTGPPAKGLYPARVASLAGFSLLGDSHLRRVTPPPGSIDAQNLTCELISEFVSSEARRTGVYVLGKGARAHQRPCGPNLSTSHVGGAVVLTRFYGDSSVSPQLAGVACERSVSASKEKLN